MAIQIINCPACGTFLLDDTAECHACAHILNANRAATTKRRSLPTDQAVDEDMDVCTTCGESVRKGLVRCWSCGAFTRPEIELAYRQRTIGAETDRTFDLPELDATSVTEQDSMVRRSLATPENLLDAPPMAREEDDDDDFELSAEVHMSEVDDSSFDLSDDIHLRTEGSTDGDTAAPYYSMPPIADLPPPSVSMPVDQEMETIPLLSSPTAVPVGSPVESDVPSISMSPLGDALPVANANAKSALSPEEELMKIAADEEAEISQVRKGMKSKDSFVVYCPQGHRIRVRDRFRGKTGKCPRCASVFIVPHKSSPKPKKRTDVEINVVGGAAGNVTGRYARWLSDVHLHNVVPEKLKLKADSLLNEFQTVDLGFSGNEILVVTLVAAGGLFGGAAKKKPAARTAMLGYFAKPDAAPDGLTAAAKRVIAKETFAQLVLAQPVPLGTESLFGNIPIFGTGRIAVRLPRAADDKNTQYLSFSLSEYRAFFVALQAVCGIEAFGANSEIPLSDRYEMFKCHYSETPVRSLQQLEYYQKDPNLKLDISGWKCSTCGLIVSEDARKKEKIGGLNGKGIAKAPCPKCKQKFGSNPMYAIAETSAPTTAAEPAPEA